MRTGVAAMAQTTTSSGVQVHLDAHSVRVLREVAGGDSLQKALTDAIALSRTVAKSKSEGYQVKLVVIKDGKRGEVPL